MTFSLLAFHGTKDVDAEGGIYIYMIKAYPNSTTTYLSIVQKEIIHNARFAGEHFFVCISLYFMSRP